MRNQRGNMQLAAVVILIVGVLVGIYLVQQRTNLLPKAASPGRYTYQPTPSQNIQNDNDLVKTSNELDDKNIDSLDQQLGQNDNDLNTF